MQTSLAKKHDRSKMVLTIAFTVICICLLYTSPHPQQLYGREQPQGAQRYQQQDAAAQRLSAAASPPPCV